MSRPNGCYEDDVGRGDLARAVRSVPKPDPRLSRIEKIRSIVKDHQYNRVEGRLVDAFTASAILQVWEACGEENRKKLEAMSLGRMADACFKVINRAASR